VSGDEVLENLKPMKRSIRNNKGSTVRRRAEMMTRRDAKEEKVSE